LYIWPKSQALPSGVKEVIQAFQSVGTPRYMLSNSSVFPIYQMAEQARAGGQQTHMEEEEQEEKGEEEEEEGSTPFETPIHTVMPPLAPVRKVDERVHAKLSPSLLPKPTHAASKTSNIATKSTKREEVEPSTSQSGRGRDDPDKKSYMRDIWRHSTPTTRQSRWHMKRLASARVT
jgi:hypothetical protein